MTWQEDHIENAERMIVFAKSCIPPGKIGGVAIHLSQQILDYDTPASRAFYEEPVDKPESQD